MYCSADMPRDNHMFLAETISNLIQHFGQEYDFQVDNCPHNDFRPGGIIWTKWPGMRNGEYKTIRMCFESHKKHHTLHTYVKARGVPWTTGELHAFSKALKMTHGSLVLIKRSLPNSQMLAQLNTKNGNATRQLRTNPCNVSSGLL